MPPPATNAERKGGTLMLEPGETVHVITRRSFDKDVRPKAASDGLFEAVPHERAGRIVVPVAPIDPHPRLRYANPRRE